MKAIWTSSIFSCRLRGQPAFELKSKLEMQIDETGQRYELHTVLVDITNLKAIELQILDSRFQKNPATEVDAEDFLPITMFEPPCRAFNKISFQYSDSYAIGSSFPNGAVEVAVDGMKLCFNKIEDIIEHPRKSVEKPKRRAYRKRSELSDPRYGPDATVNRNGVPLSLRLPASLLDAVEVAAKSVDSDKSNWLRAAFEYALETRLAARPAKYDDQRCDTTFMLRVDENLRNSISEHAERCKLKKSTWMKGAVEHCLDGPGVK